MKNTLHIFFAILITLATVIPAGLVVCEKNGKISIEFENGKVCSCDIQSIDLASKFCCEDIECHEIENVTAQCHDEQHLQAEDCSDTKIESVDALKYFSNSAKAPVKTFKTSSLFVYEVHINEVIYGLNTPMDVGKAPTINEVINQALAIKKSAVFLI